MQSYPRLIHPIINLWIADGISNTIKTNILIGTMGFGRFDNIISLASHLR